MQFCEANCEVSGFKISISFEMIFCRAIVSIIPVGESCLSVCIRRKRNPLIWGPQFLIKMYQQDFSVF